VEEDQETILRYLSAYLNITVKTNDISKINGHGYCAKEAVKTVA